MATRLIYSGLGVFFFPEQNILRVTLSLVTVSANMLFCAKYRPVAKLSMDRATTAMNGICWGVVVMAILSWAEASEDVQVAYSSVVTLFFVVSCAVMYRIKRKEPEYALVALISARQPFDEDEFRAVDAHGTGSHASRAEVSFAMPAGPGFAMLL